MSREFARARGLTHHEVWSRASRLWQLYELGEWDELLEEAEPLARWDRAQGGTQIEVGVLIACAPVHAHRGRVDEAAREVAIFLPRALEIGTPQTLAPGPRPRRLRLGDGGAARRSARARQGVRADDVRSAELAHRRPRGRGWRLRCGRGTRSCPDLGRRSRRYDTQSRRPEHAQDGSGRCWRRRAG